MRWLVLWAAACGGAGKPPADPAAGWTVRAACQAEAARAQQERSLWTSEDRRAAAVFAYAECERERLARREITIDTVADYAGDVTHAYDLYWEAFRTHERRWEIGAFARIGDLFAAAAGKVDALGGAGSAAVARRYHTQAEQAWRWALRYAADAPAEVLADERVGIWLRAACAGLAATEDPACAR